jgi:pimeloyl-ACP methyl ester carboxylesterase
MTQVYFIGGLGADHTVFDRLTLREDIEAHHLPWLVPKENESLGHYARRMAEGIADPENATLVGLSFGGIMSIEIAQRFPIKQVVLISSVKSKAEMPINFDLIGLMRLHQVVPPSRIMHIRDLAAWFFGVKTEDERNMLFGILERSNERIVDWSTEQIIAWKGDHDVKNIRHIHGTADTAFPIRKIKADKKVKGGPHFMVYTHAKEVSAWLNEVL